MVFLQKIVRFLIHYKRAFFYFFKSAWIGTVEATTAAGFRELAMILGLVLGGMAAVGLFGLLVLTLAILTSRSSHFHTDLTWNNWGFSVAQTMLVMTFEMLAILVCLFFVRPIISHWFDAWYKTSSRARAIKLMQ